MSTAEPDTVQNSPTHEPLPILHIIHSHLEVKVNLHGNGNFLLVKVGFFLNTVRYRISVICSPRYPCTEQTENRGFDRELLICPVPVSNFSHVKGGGSHLLLALILMELLVTCLNPHNLSCVSPTHLTSTRSQDFHPRTTTTTKEQYNTSLCSCGVRKMQRPNLSQHNSVNTVLLARRVRLDP